MKKIYIVLAVIIVIVIATIIGFLIFNKTKSKKQDSQNIIVNDNETENSLSNSETENLDNKNKEITDNIEDSLKGYTVTELEELIQNFYGEYNGVNVKEIVFGYNKNGEFTATVSNESEIFAEYVFDLKTGYAKDEYTGITIDFINGKIVNQIKNKEELFINNQSLAIGYVNKNTESEFIRKYFDGDAAYNSLTMYDLRTRQDGTENKYAEKIVIVPKDENSKVTLSTCKIGENGKVQTDQTIIDKNSEPFILLFDNAEQTTPQYIIELEVGKTKTSFPIVFSGENNKLDVLKYENEVLDISIYK